MSVWLCLGAPTTPSFAIQNLLGLAMLTSCEQGAPPFFGWDSMMRVLSRKCGKLFWTRKCDLWRSAFHKNVMKNLKKCGRRDWRWWLGLVSGDCWTIPPPQLREQLPEVGFSRIARLCEAPVTLFASPFYFINRRKGQEYDMTWSISPKYLSLSRHSFCNPLDKATRCKQSLVPVLPGRVAHLTSTTEHDAKSFPHQVVMCNPMESQ